MERKINTDNISVGECGISCNDGQYRVAEVQLADPDLPEAEVPKTTSEGIVTEAIKVVLRKNFVEMMGI